MNKIKNIQDNMNRIASFTKNSDNLIKIKKIIIIQDLINIMIWYDFKSLFYLNNLCAQKILKVQK